MNSEFSKTVSEILAFSREEARRTYCPMVLPEHLMLAIIRQRENKVMELLKYWNTNTAVLKDYLETSLPVPQTVHKSMDLQDIILDEKTNNLLRLSVLEARLQHTAVIDETHLLLGILHDQMQNNAQVALGKMGIDYEQVVKTLKNGLTLSKEQGEDPHDYLGNFDDNDDDDDDMLDEQPLKKYGDTAVANKKSKSETPVLDNFGTDLTRAASDGKLDPVVGRQQEMMRVVEILGRRKKNNPILIGEPGVGKSAIVEGLAQLIVAHKTSPLLFDKRIISLDLSSLVAGTKYRGQFEERVKSLIRELENHPEIIIFIDEIHTLVGAGSATGTMDAANMLKPALARGVIQCIGSTTIDEYRKSIEKDGALERRFQKVMVEATNADETLQILENLRERYEEHHHVTYTPDVLRQCVLLTERYITERQFPDKAIDALDEVGSHVHLANVQMPKEMENMDKRIAHIKEMKNKFVKERVFDQAAHFRDLQLRAEEEMARLTFQWMKDKDRIRSAVSESDVARVVSVMSGVPVQRIETSEMERLRTMGDALKEEVIGQDKAIETIVRAIRRNRVGLREPNRPIGVFMFLGPTGVGKTYLAKKLAENMFGTADSIIRVDMSEFTESFNVSKLVGAPPGYVGYDEGGQLTEKVRRKPYSIVLLDELEKAHSNVFNLLLQVLDEGRLTDGNGRMVDFRNTIIIMTSNAGTKQLKEFGRGIGFNSGAAAGLLAHQDREHANAIIRKALSKQFSPEFLNRMDEIITFEQLDLPSIKRIIELELRGLYQRIEALGHTLTITDAAKDFVATKGYDVQFGARPLKRAIQSYLEDALCERIVNDNGEGSKNFVADVKDGKVVVS